MMKFELKLKNKTIGNLIFSEGIWTWQYSNDFHNHDLKPLIGFSVLEKIYQSEKLWPFFSQRIPSIKRPEIIAITKSKGIDSNSEADMLRYFGEKVISNPYTLKFMD